MKNALFVTLFLGIIIVIVSMVIPQKYDAVTYNINITNIDFKMKLLALGEVISIFSFGALIAKRFNKK